VIPTGSADMMAYPVLSPGKIGDGRVFCKLNQPKGATDTGGDGLCVDTNGNLYITSWLGVQIFDPSGKHLGTIPIPEYCANCDFGGPDMKTLYVTASKSLYAIKMDATGLQFGTPTRKRITVAPARNFP
jgi:gluconolactonase